jgi:HNH endonuclease
MSITLVKIAPGHQAEYWDQCRQEGYICVGWDSVGDLTKFRSKQEFYKVFEKEYLSEYNGKLATTRRKANELWTLVELLPGDKVIANRGSKTVLAVGTVQKSGYEWRPTQTRTEYFHTVKVKWDESLAKTIPPQSWNNTVAPLSYDLFKKIAGSSAPPIDSVRDLDDLTDERVRIETTVKDRQGQPQFREKLLGIYARHCAVSDCDASAALEAAHIRPYIGPKSNDSCNGILLRADLHRLFDNHLLGIHPDTLRVFVSPKLMSSVYRSLDGTILRTPSYARHNPDKGCLKDRYRYYRDKNGMGDSDPAKSCMPNG